MCPTLYMYYNYYNYNNYNYNNNTYSNFIFKYNNLVCYLINDI